MCHQARQDRYTLVDQRKSHADLSLQKARKADTVVAQGDSPEAHFL